MAAGGITVPAGSQCPLYASKLHAMRISDIDDLECGVQPDLYACRIPGRIDSGDEKDRAVRTGTITIVYRPVPGMEMAQVHTVKKWFDHRQGHLAPRLFESVAN
jgi:hypothetical protein